MSTSDASSPEGAAPQELATARKWHMAFNAAKRQMTGEYQEACGGPDCEFCLFAASAVTRAPRIAAKDRDAALSRPQAPTDQRIAELVWELRQVPHPRDRQIADALTALQQRVDELRFSLTAAEKRATEAEHASREADLKLRLYENSDRVNQPLVDDIERWRVESDQAIQKAEQSRLDALTAKAAAEQRLEAAEQQLSILRGTVSQDAATIAQLIGEKEAAERERDAALAATKAESLAHLAIWFNERTILIGSLRGEKQRAEVTAVTERAAKEAAEATIARLRAALEHIRDYSGDPAIENTANRALAHALVHAASSSVRTAETEEPYDKGRK
jgi:chromosome segregation ATPase